MKRESIMESLYWWQARARVGVEGGKKRPAKKEKSQLFRERQCSELSLWGTGVNPSARNPGFAGGRGPCFFAKSLGKHNGQQCRKALSAHVYTSRARRRQLVPGSTCSPFFSLFCPSTLAPSTPRSMFDAWVCEDSIFRDIILHPVGSFPSPMYTVALLFPVILAPSIRWLRRSRDYLSRNESLYF